MGFQRGEVAALPFGRTRGFKPRVRYNLIFRSMKFLGVRSNLTGRGLKRYYESFVMKSVDRFILVTLIFALVSWGFLLMGKANADIYVLRDSQGVLHFTNIPSDARFRPVFRERGGNSSSFSLPPSHFDKIIRSAARRHNVDPDLVRAVIKAESNFNSRALSRKGAQGLMQLMPGTAREQNVADVYDPGENINAGVRHLRTLLDHYRGDVRLSLAAYNAGINAVERYGGVPPFRETREYVRRVLDYRRRYRGIGTISIREQTRR